MPASIDMKLRKLDPLRFIVAVENEEQAIDAIVGAVLARVELHADRASVHVFPPRSPQFTRVPGQIRHAVIVEVVAQKELSSLEDRKTTRQRDRFAEKFGECLVARSGGPVEPADVVVLAVRVVVAALAPCALVAA